MKKLLTVRTRWEYYAANLGGILFILGLLIWLVTLLVRHGFDLKSIIFWLALILFVSLLFAFISFFSSMKTVEVTATGLTISYIFQKHKNVLLFSEVAEMKAKQTANETKARPRTFRDTFKLVLADGRTFEFERSQFDQYNQLKTICFKRVKG